MPRGQTANHGPGGGDGEVNAAALAPAAAGPPGEGEGVDAAGEPDEGVDVAFVVGVGVCGTRLAGMAYVRADIPPRQFRPMTAVPCLSPLEP